MIITLGVIAQTILLYLNCKLLIRNLRVTKSELALVLIILVISTATYFRIGAYSSLIIIPCVFGLNFFTQKKWAYALGITSYAAIISVLSDHLATMFEVYILSIKNSSFTAEYIIRHMMLSFLLSLMSCFLISRLLIRLEEKTSLDVKNNLFIIIMGLTTMIIYYASVYLGVSLGNSVNLIQLNLLFFIGYLVITLLVFFFYIHSLKNKYEMKQKEVEYESMRQYAESIEEQYQEMRKFRHDYKNILSSLDSYILENDYAGLKEYYLKKIKPSSGVMSRNDFKLDSLANVKIKELKSILAYKLISAQESGIDTNVETREPIDNLSIDSVILVRIMGIILDNAIEELQDLKAGTLSVALFEDSKSAQIIVRNTCRKDIPKIHKLKKEGFSTKGSNRGLGLSNISEMIKESENVILETIIENDCFTQRLIINK